MSDETFDLEPLKDDRAPITHSQPLPRLWKTEPDPEDDSDESVEGLKQKKASKSEDAAKSAPKSSSKSKAPAKKPAKPKKKVDDGEKADGRVLVEETPRFDTIESRQRARLAVGGLMVFCVFIFGWIIHGMVFSGSGELQVNTVELPPETVNRPPAPPLSRDSEALYMLHQARDYAKRHKTKEAIDLLSRIAKVYKGTPASAEAQAALDRPRQNLPLFPDGPFMLAQKTAAPPPASQPPPGSPSGSPPPAPRRAAPPPTGPELMALARPGMHPPAAGPVPPPGGPSQPPPAQTTPQPPPAQTAPQPAPSQAGLPPNLAMPARRPPSQSVPSPPTQAQAGPSQPMPPGPGEVTLVIPPNAGNAPTPAPAGENTSTGTDRDKPSGLHAGRMLPPGFKPKIEAGVHESGWPMVIVGERDGGTMVLVPGATFTMGSDRGDRASGPAHFVRLSTYYIDQHEITNRQFRIFLDETRYHGQPPGKWLTDPKLRSAPADEPVVSVNYHDAEEYAIWSLKRIATEAQWEMAARSTDGRRYPWGEQPVHWSRPRSFHQIDPVMSFPNDVSPFGVFDLAGNAVEWVRDWYDPSFYDRLHEKVALDPTGPSTKRQGIQRVVKGSSKDWLIYSRQGMDLDRRLPYVGFRCSLAVEGGEASAIISPHPATPAASPPGVPAPGQPADGVVPF